MIEALKLFLIGIALGVANVIPGVSGGTLAVVFNIYDRFINAITYNVKKLWKNRSFLIPILLGVGVGLVAFSKLITWLYARFPVQTNSFFAGLIVGSIPLLTRLIFPKGGTKLSFTKILALIFSFAIGFFLILIFARLGLSADKSVSVQELPKITPLLAIHLFAGGFLGAVAMVIPGISGSLLMLIVGVYPVIIAAIPELFHASTMLASFLILFPAGLGVLAGLLAGAKTIGLLLKKIPGPTYSVILGLIAASAITVCPWKEIGASPITALTSIAFIAAGFALSFLNVPLNFS